MKKVLIAAVAAASMIAGIGAAQADGTDPHETQLFRDRGAIIVTPENKNAPVPSLSQSRQFNWVNRQQQQRGSYPMDSGYGDTLDN